MLLDDIPVEISEAEWKRRPEVHSWFHSMSALPPVLYFINDSDACDYFLFGDMLASGHFCHCTGTVNRNVMTEFTEEQREVIANRVFHSSWCLLMYCHATGFNPDKYIDALLADYDMPFIAADVRKRYNEEIEKGIRFGIVAEPK